MTDDLERRLREAAKDRAQMERETPGAYPRPPRQHIEWQAADEIARLREALEHIAALSDQREEPWPEGSEMDRLHFWRDRVIEAAEAARRALQEGSRHE